MPELPEVETTIRGLKPLIGSSINNIKINTPKLRFFIPKNIIKIKKKVAIDFIKRRGKFIIFILSNNHSIVIHLGMSGRLQLYKKEEYLKKKHDHFLLEFQKNQLMVFNDSRRFGFIDYDLSKEINLRKYLLNLGEEALDPSCNYKYLFLKISKKMVPIKQILLDQKVIAGIGNIYASEILFNAKISPYRLGKDLALNDCRKIEFSIKKILKKAINAGGSTLKDYVSTDGTLGNFQKKFMVYNREGKKISGSKIKKIVQYGRATYFCPKMQK